MAVPTLPQNDPQPDEREAGLAADRSEVRFDRSQFGMIFPSAVPAADQFSFRWDFEAEALEVVTELEELKGAWEVAADDTRTPEERLRSVWGALLQGLEQRFAPTARKEPFRPLPWQAREPLTVAEHALLFGDLPRTQAVSCWNDDAFFAHQRIASDCNGLIRLVRDLEDWSGIQARMPLSEEVFARASGGDSLTRAVEEHRLLVCDLRLLEGIEPGYHGPWRRWLPAPIALFALADDRRTLRPVAIQCGQSGGERFPIWTPGDGPAWAMARACYNGAESTYHGVVEHGAHCHMMMGAIAVATHRCLARNHPVRVLLTPHLEMTIAIARATGDLYIPGGRTSTLQSISVEGIAELTHRCWKAFDWHQCSLDRHFGHRGLGSGSVMADMPVRDDLQLYNEAILRFVGSYVPLYYAEDGDVGRDPELQDWVRTIQSPEGAGLPTFGTPSSPRGDHQVSTIADLVDCLASVLWRAGPWHASVNYPVYETTAFAPAYPSALFAPPPRRSPMPVEDDLLSLLPPEAVVQGLFVDLMQVSNLRLNRFGNYPAGTFEDARVHGMVDRLKLDLEGIGTRISERNRFRALPYPFLHPELVTASVHI